VSDEKLWDESPTSRQFLVHGDLLKIYWPTKFSSYKKFR